MRFAAVMLAGLTAFAAPVQGQDAQGRDGEVRVFFWQAPSILNPYLTGGLKDIEAASLVLEPLARHDTSGQMVPWLVDEIPTLENGGVSADLMTITWRLSEGLLWSDGTPLTSRDVAFTHAYCTADGGGCAQIEKFSGVADVETPDARTVIIRFNEPRPFPYGPFVGAQSPILQEAQFKDCLGPASAQCAKENFTPIGTGPFMVETFRPNDSIRMQANPNFRDPTKPAFASLVLKGGGSAETAGRAVLQSGDFDYGWNLQLPPEVLAGMARGGKGQIVTAFGTLVERVVFNLSNPSADLGAKRSTVGQVHPILSDKSVRQALSMAIDRTILTQIGYGETGSVTCNILPAPAIYASDANDACKVQDIESAKALLDAAGWIDSDGDGVRDKDGQPLALVFQTSTNAVRQTFQQAIKSWWTELGVTTELRSIDPNVFFGSDPNSPDTFQKFYADAQMFAQSFDGTDAEAYLGQWVCDAAPGPDNGWQGSNIMRYCNPTYDALVAELRKTAPPELRAALARTMNDMLMQDFVVLPLVHRGRVSAHSNGLGGVALNTWDSELWNAADWVRKAAQ